jgi:hypothetical protein
MSWAMRRSIIWRNVAPILALLLPEPDGHYFLPIPISCSAAAVLGGA